MSWHSPPSPSQISVRVDSQTLSDMSDPEIAGKKKQRGTVCAFTCITKMVTCVADMERRAPLSPTDEIVAKRMEQKTYNLHVDKDFEGITTPFLI